jgi:hypothetical protein
MAGSFNFEADPAHECGGSACESDRTLIEFGRVPGARITVDDETVLLREYTQEFADVAPAIHQVGGGNESAREKSSVAVENG